MEKLTRFLLVLLTMSSVKLFAQFDGIVGSEGCKAIHCDSPQFIEWATGCTVIRGYMNIAQPQNGYASYGEETDVTGKVTENTAVVSLGDGGTAVLTFQTPIANGAGYDFAVFENSFSDDFLELAFVEVSSDGVNYFRFPATSNTQTTTQIGGYGTLNATLINNLAGKYKAGWGTPFDLDELPDDDNLDKNDIRYVKIVDVVGTIDPEFATYDFFGNIVNDPYPTAFASGGFDLAGVGVIHNRNTVSIFAPTEILVSLFPNPCKNTLYINATPCEIALKNALGQKLQQWKSTETQLSIDMSGYASGIYFIELQNNQSRKVIKVVK